MPDISWRLIRRDADWIGRRSVRLSRLYGLLVVVHVFLWELWLSRLRVDRPRELFGLLCRLRSLAPVEPRRPSLEVDTVRYR